MDSPAYVNASTPPRCHWHTPASSFASSAVPSASRVDALYNRQPPQVSFADSSQFLEGEERESADFAASPAYSRGSPYSRYREEKRETSRETPQPCWSCRQTQRLRRSLKKIELDYIAQIERLQQDVRHATAQRALAIKERNELLSSADEVAAQQLLVEQEAQSLRVEVMQSVQERQNLRERVRALEGVEVARGQQQWMTVLKVLEEAEVATRRETSAAEEGERALLRALCASDITAAQALLTKSTTANTPSRCHVGTGETGAGSTILSQTFSPNSSSPGASDGGGNSRERRLCSPRPSQRRSQTAQEHATHPPARTSEAPQRSVSASARAVVSRELVLTHTAEDAEETARKMERRLEQQRSDFEMQLAEERALAADMQAEVDDLIENELVLLEANARLELERDAAGTMTSLLSGPWKQMARSWKSAVAEMDALKTLQTREEAEGVSLRSSSTAEWRDEVRELISNMQHQLYQLTTAKATPAYDAEEACEEVKDCVREEAASIKEHLGALLDASAEARVDGDQLRHELLQQLSQVLESQRQQEASLHASPWDASALQAIQQQLERQRTVSEKVEFMLQRQRHVVSTAQVEKDTAPTTSNLLPQVYPVAPTTAVAATTNVARSCPTTAASVSIPTRVESQRRERSLRLSDVGAAAATVALMSNNPTNDLSDATSVMSASLSPQIGKHPGASASNSRDDAPTTFANVSESTVDTAPSSSSAAQPSRRCTTPSLSDHSSFVVPEEALFAQHRRHIDATAAVEHISALLSDEDDENPCNGDSSCPYEEY